MIKRSYISVSVTHINFAYKSVGNISVTKLLLLIYCLSLQCRYMFSLLSTYYFIILIVLSFLHGNSKLIRHSCSEIKMEA